MKLLVIVNTLEGIKKSSILGIETMELLYSKTNQHSQSMYKKNP